MLLVRYWVSIVLVVYSARQSSDVYSGDKEKMFNHTINERCKEYKTMDDWVEKLIN